MKDIRPLRTEADYDWALAEVEHYFNRQPEPGTPDGDRFAVLADLIEAYEAHHWPVGPVDPIEAIRYRMEIGGKTRRDLAALLGSRSRASEILRRRRALTLPMIHKLNREWGIPAEVLITPYHLDKAA
ncbi:XRE family transcriptional regulator [Labrys miyagiensis]|uniref:XRE family transcriptional regulator n=1 Tax=Labrys miyagiensis TaxID=346912 RepID=A0ABQ6CDJ6_9HYPH|nr:XRE family transcriptional regulator [Labrys miyagiensis]GLS17869.1 XRE family transcriptional regulator [Labrys miyagiensis]